VTVRAGRAGDELRFDVVDTGVGIAPADQDRVFDEFAQAGDGLTGKPSGTGLGLPICRQIVEHHGGRIWLTSEPGAGSTFSCALPIAAAADLEAVERRNGQRREGAGGEAKATAGTGHAGRERRHGHDRRAPSRK
jgi:K+-sensing histidine kinase KdpD